MATTPAATLAKNRRDANALAVKKGQAETKAMLEKAAADLRDRLPAVSASAGDESFTATQMRATLAQVEDAVASLTKDMRATMLSQVKSAATKSAEGVVDYLKRANRQYGGVGVQPLAIREASMIDRAVRGANASLLRRIGTAPEGAREEEAQGGVLARYGTETIGKFEETLQRALITRKPWAEVRADLIAESPFLQQAPAYWAERIVRTETIAAYNRGGWEATRTAQAALGDMVKILAATFDDRTGSDSFAVHGQIRRTDEAFEWWDGKYQHPPNRPNDREIVVPHRIAWPLPDYLTWKTDAEVFARWKKEGRKGSPPARPNMTTVDIDRFGKG